VGRSRLSIRGDGSDARGRLQRGSFVMGHLGRPHHRWLAAVVLAGLVALPAGAGATAPSVGKPPRPTPSPDGWIAKGLAGTPVGDGVVNTTGAGQSVAGVAKASKRITFVITIQNDGTGSGHLRVQAEGSGSGFTVVYLQGTTDVTDAVVGGTYYTGVLAAGASERLIAKVRVTASAPVGSSITRLVTASAAGHPPVLDAVGFTAKRSS